MRELNQKIADDYHPKPYGGPVVILRASEQPAGAQPDPSLGWSKHISGPIFDYVIPGNHESIFREPSVQLLAEKLQACIDEWLETQASLEISNTPFDLDQTRMDRNSMTLPTPVNQPQGLPQVSLKSKLFHHFIG